jgi:hypothetical protein
MFNDGGDAGSDLYFSPVGTLSNNGSNTPNFGSSNLMVVPLACTMTQLNVAAYVQTLFSVSPGTAQITLYHGVGAAAPTATALTCTTGTIAHAVGSFASCSDNTHTAVIAAGDILTLKLHEPTDNTSNDAVQFAVHLRCQ